MSKALMIAKREFRYNLRRPAFLFAAFGTPLLIVGIWIVIFAVTDMAGGDEELVTNQIGYVDNAGVIAADGPVEMSASEPEEGEEQPAETYTFVPYADTDSARQALDDEAIAAYYVIAADYYVSAGVERVNYGEIPASVNGAFRRLLRQSLSAELDQNGALAGRLSEPVRDMTVTLLDSGRVISDDSLPILFLVPFFFAIVFFLASQTTSSFLMNGLVEEKKNHIIEILVTTVTPMQLLTGKIIGLGLLGILQVVVWLSIVVAAFVFGPQIPLLSIFEGATLPTDLILLGIVYFVLGYFLTASLLASVGVLVGSEQQSNQYAAFIMLPGYFIPLIFASQFIIDANGTVPTLLSIVPVMAPISMVMRLGFTSVPLWQLSLSIGLQLLATLFAIWVSAKLFRWGLLLYGKKISFKDVLRVIRSRSTPEPGIAHATEPARKEA